MAGPLRGLKIIETGGLGPAPFCAMLLADMGAEIVRIERPGGAALIAHRFDVTARSREMLELDLRPGHKKLGVTH
jgi:alpha-methylacyl-CoA racemase